MIKKTITKISSKIKILKEFLESVDYEVQKNAKAQKFGVS